MSKVFPACPSWMRITDQELRPLVNTTHHYSQREHEWTDKEKLLLIQMREQGKTFGEIARAIGKGLTESKCNSKYHDLDRKNELDKYESQLRQ